MYIYYVKIHMYCIEVEKDTFFSTMYFEEKGIRASLSRRSCPLYFQPPVTSLLLSISPDDIYRILELNIWYRFLVEIVNGISTKSDEHE